jgi:hypothetical protein
VGVKILCDLNDVYMTICMSICIIVYCLSSCVNMFISQIALKHLYTNYNFIAKRRMTNSLVSRIALVGWVFFLSFV